MPEHELVHRVRDCDRTVSHYLGFPAQAPRRWASAATPGPGVRNCRLVNQDPQKRCSHPGSSDNRDPLPPGGCVSRLFFTHPSVEWQVGWTLPGNSQQVPPRVPWKVGGRSHPNLEVRSCGPGSNRDSSPKRAAWQGLGGAAHAALNVPPRPPGKCVNLCCSGTSPGTAVARQGGTSRFRFWRGQT